MHTLHLAQTLALVLFVGCGPDKGAVDTARSDEQPTDDADEVGLIGESFGGGAGPVDGDGGPSDGGGVVGGEEPDPVFFPPGGGREDGAWGPGYWDTGDGTWVPGEDGFPGAGGGPDIGDDPAGDDTGLGLDGGVDSGAAIDTADAGDDTGGSLFGEQDGANDGQGALGGAQLSTKGSCSCSSAAHPAGSAWALALLGLVGWRRREGSGRP
jgi:MYXO-CTERM domain-containing protein